MSAAGREPGRWNGNLTRGTARLCGRIDGAPAYGGTPDDRPVIEAITDLKARGLKVVLYPFVLMDIVPGNGLPDPYGGAEQAALPWRGRLTSMPAPGEPGTTDGTARIDADIAALCGTAAPGDIMCLRDTRELGRGHRCRLPADDPAPCRAGAGRGRRRWLSDRLGDGRVDAAEQWRGGFPLSRQLVALAEDVKGDARAGDDGAYGADWSEYFGFHPDDGSGDVLFPSRPAVGEPGDRRRRHRQLHAAVGLARQRS